MVRSIASKALYALILTIVLTFLGLCIYLLGR